MEIFFTPTVIISAGVVGYLVGTVWFSPILFMKWFLDGEGLTKETLPNRGKGYMTWTMVYSFILHLVFATSFAYLLDILYVMTMREAICISLLVSLGFITIVKLIDLVYSTHGTFLDSKNQKKAFVASGYFIVMFVVMALVMYYVA